MSLTSAYLGSLLMKFGTGEIIACGVLAGVAFIMLCVLVTLAVKAKKKEQKSAETSSVAEERKEAAETSAEEKISESPVAETEEQATEEQPAEEEIPESPVAETEGQATEEQPAEEEIPESPVAEAEEQATEEQPAEEEILESPVAETEEQATEEQPAEEEIPESPVAEEKEQPAEEQPAEETPEETPEETVNETVEEISGENEFVSEELVRREEPEEAREEKIDEKEAEELAGESLVGVVREEVRGEEVLHAYAVRTKQFVAVRYSKSFTAKLIQSDDETKDYYSRLKNELLSYRRVKARMSWRRESFRIGRKLIARMQYRGKKLCLYLALDPKAYEGTKYYVEDVSAVASNAGAPLLYRIKSERRAKYALDLIKDVCTQNGEEKKKLYQKTDFSAEYPYDTTESLVERGLVKEIRYKETQEEVRSALEHAREGQSNAEIKASEVKGLMHDEVAAALVIDSVGYSDKSKTAVINVDTLNEYFADGEKVTLETIKQKISYVSKKTTYVKILARGALNKALTVEADDFSLDAIKMIVLAGGTAIRRKAGVELKK